MTHYFIEFRFHGKAKREMKELIWRVNKKFRIFSPKRPIPHITLVAPFYTSQEHRLVNDFKQVCEKHPLVKFKISGYGTFDSSKVVHIKIIPSEKMTIFRNALIKKIKSYCTLNSTDAFSFLGIIKVSRKYSPHATIAMKLSPMKFMQVKEFTHHQPSFQYEHNLLRATLIKNSKILYEYDFVQRRLLNRREAKSKMEFRKTIGLFKEGNFRREA
ncbi:2'-5' RNA ligase family protein [Candidatus Pacearchaeota archaeon]|nr:2'-5' RNA ligase family protein [Candidatus Pacearchaeota archaeon]